MNLEKFDGKTIAECKKNFQVSKRGLHRNVNGYLYWTLIDKESNEKFSVFLTKACSANFEKGDRPYSLKFTKVTLSSTKEETYKLGMGSLEFMEIPDDL